MSQRQVGSQLKLLRRGDVIEASFLNSIAAKAERNARAIAEEETQEPEGEDYSDLTFSEVSRVTSTVRIEDQNDPNIYVEIDRIDSLLLSGPQGTLRLNFNNPDPPE